MAILPQLDAGLVVTILAALVFNFLDGYVASSSLVATIIASRTLGPRPALLLASIGEFIGPLVLGVAVAGTIGKNFITIQFLPLAAVLAMLVGAIVWLLLTYRLGLPVSPSHALVGGILGAAVAAEGFSVVHTNGLVIILASLLAAPLIAWLVGWVFMHLILFLARDASPHINRFFKSAQVLTSGLLAISQGSNDAQKTMGVIVMALVARGVQPAFSVPTWVIVLCAAVIAGGVGSGGSRTIRTVGAKFYRVRPVHGFATQTVAASVVLIAGLLGAPVSAGQVVSSALVGVGSAERMSKIRWEVMVNLVVAWLFTIPAAALMSGALYFVLARFM